MLIARLPARIVVWSQLCCKDCLESPHVICGVMLCHDYSRYRN